jgi:hypothetical protein
MSNSITKNTSENTETALVPVDELDANIIKAASALNSLADVVDAALGEKILELARFTTPTIKGIEGPQRITIPQIFMRQPSSNTANFPTDCQVGHLYNTNGDTLGPEIVLVPILRHSLRQKWGDDTMDCMSLDGVVGTRYGKCEECPYGRFVENQRPACSQGHSFYCVTEDLAALYRINFMKSSAKAGRTILKLTRPPALWARSFKISTENKTGQNRNYYELKAQATGQKTPAEMMQVCDALHDFYYALYQRALGGQALFMQRLASGEPVPEGVDPTISESTDGTIDFADSM